MLLVLFGFSSLDLWQLYCVKVETGGVGTVDVDTPFFVVNLGDSANHDVSHLAVVSRLERNHADQLVGLLDVADQTRVDGTFVSVGAATPGENSLLDKSRLSRDDVARQHEVERYLVVD